MRFERHELDEATKIVRRHVPPTPQYSWPLLDEVAGSRVIVKHENHTPVGAFKVRGGLVYMDRLVRERPHVEGVVSATRGNHGQSLAFAGRHAGRSVTIFVPHGNSVEKNDAMRALGADVVEFGRRLPGGSRAFVGGGRRTWSGARPAVSSRPRARRRDVRARVVRRRRSARHGLRAGRDGVRHQRPHRRTRSPRTRNEDRRRRVGARPLDTALVRTGRGGDHRRRRRRSSTASRPGHRTPRRSRESSPAPSGSSRCPTTRPPTRCGSSSEPPTTSPSPQGRSRSPVC